MPQKVSRRVQGQERPLPDEQRDPVERHWVGPEERRAVIDVGFVPEVNPVTGRQADIFRRPRVEHQ